MAGHAPEHLETSSLIASDFVAGVGVFSNYDEAFSQFHNGMGRQQ